MVEVLTDDALVELVALWASTGAHPGGGQRASAEGTLWRSSAGPRPVAARALVVLRGWNGPVPLRTATKTAAATAVTQTVVLRANAEAKYVSQDMCFAR